MKPAPLLKGLGEIKFSPRERLLVALVGGLFVFYGITAFLIKPFLSQWSRYGALTEKEEVRIMKLQKILSQAPSIEKQYVLYKKKMSAQKSDEEVMSDLQKEIDLLAHRAQVKIPLMNPGNPQKADFYRIYPVEIKIEGTAPQIAQFLFYLQRSDLLMKVEEAKLSTSLRDSALNGQISISRALVPLEDERGKPKE